MEYRITLAVGRCTALTLRFLATSWWKIHLHVVEFLAAISPVFMSVYIYLSYGGVWSLQGSSYICISVKLEPFRCPALDRKSPPQRRNVAKYFRQRSWFGEKFVPQTAICYQKSINIRQSFHLGRRATLYREGLINVNRNLDKAVYKKEDFKRQVRRCSFSISFIVFMRQFWNRVRKRDSCST